MVPPRRSGKPAEVRQRDGGAEERGEEGAPAYTAMTRPTMTREAFGKRVEEIIAALRDTPDLAPSVRRSVWLKVLDLADRYGFSSRRRG